MRANKKKYIASIKNITRDSWLESEGNGKVNHTKVESKRLLFYDEQDAENTLELLNDTRPDCYTLIDERR